MGNHPFGSPEFKALQAKWTKRLRDSGFEDIEESDGNLIDEDRLSRRLKWSPERIASDAEYYRLATQYLNVGTFKNKKERRIWELHSEGLSIRAISKQVRRTRWFIQSRVEKHRPFALGRTLRGSVEAPDDARESE